MVSNVSVRMDVDTSQAKRSIQEVEEQADGIIRKWKRNKNEIERGLRDTETAISSMIGVFTSTLKVFGITIDPIFDVIVQTLIVTIQNIATIHASLAASTAGLSSYITAGFAATGIAIAWAGVFYANQQQEQMETKMNDILSMVESLEQTSAIASGIY